MGAITVGLAAVFQIATFAMLASAASFAPRAAAFRSSQRAPRKSSHAILRTELQRERKRACWLVCAVGIVFWISAVQPTTSLTLFAAQNTNLQLRVLCSAWALAPGHFMSLHALLVLVIAPPLGWGLARLRRGGQELSTPGKMAWGFAATGAAFVIMGLAGPCGDSGVQVSPSWLVSCYIMLTLGELLLAPMGLALLTRLAPPEHASRTVALWGVATAFGNGLAGGLGFLWARWSHPHYFALLALLALGATALLLRRLRSLERLLWQS